MVKGSLVLRHRVTKQSLEMEIAYFRQLDLAGLRARWKGEFRREPAPHLPQHLLFAVLAYRIQANRLGDIRADVKAILNRSVSGEKQSIVTGRIARLDRQRTILARGTILSRPWNGRSQRVTVLANGFSWNGKIYPSLTRVAFAITGTRWNGPRFFGLRNRDTVADYGAATPPQ